MNGIFRPERSSSVSRSKRSPSSGEIMTSDRSVVSPSLPQSEGADSYPVETNQAAYSSGGFKNVFMIPWERQRMYQSSGSVGSVPTRNVSVRVFRQSSSASKPEIVQMFFWTSPETVGHKIVRSPANRWRIISFQIGTAPVMPDTPSMAELSAFPTQIPNTKLGV